MICRPGMSSINRPSAGWLLAALPLSSMICGCSCAKRRGATGNPRRPFLTVEPCNRPPKVEGVQVTTGRNDAKAARSMPPLIRWATCWRSWSPLPTNKTAPRSANWHRRCKKRLANRSSWPLWTRAILVMQPRKKPTHTPCSWKSSNYPTPNVALSCCYVAGSSRTPNQNTPETLGLTEPTPCPMLGMSGLLQLLTWVEHRRVAQASQHEEGGVPCPVPHPTQLPPARFQTDYRSVGGSAPGQSSAAALAAESPPRTSARVEQGTKQGGRR